jgi:hypothetical protein
MSKNEKSLSIGTVGSNALLMGDFGMRADVMAMIKESSIDHLFIADHVSFHDGFGMDGLINAATLAAVKIDMRWRFVAWILQHGDGERTIAFMLLERCLTVNPVVLNLNFSR